MPHRETPHLPDVKEMPMAEKWDRVHDFFTMDHAISYKTHKRMGTLDEWVEDTIDAYGRLMGRFIGPLAEIMGKAAARLAPNLVLKQAILNVLYNDQMMHGPGDYRVSEVKDGEITVRFKGCLRLKKQQEIVERCQLGIDAREICELEKMHLTHPKAPAARMGIVPTDISCEEGGCVWSFRAERKPRSG
jgi:hypothetical protein